MPNLENGMNKAVAPARGIIGGISKALSNNGKRQDYVYNDPKTGRVFSPGSNGRQAPAMKNSAQARADAIARKATR